MTAVHDTAPAPDLHVWSQDFNATTAAVQAAINLSVGNDGATVQLHSNTYLSREGMIEHLSEDADAIDGLIFDGSTIDGDTWSVRVM